MLLLAATCLAASPPAKAGPAKPASGAATASKTPPEAEPAHAPVATPEATVPAALRASLRRRGLADSEIGAVAALVGRADPRLVALLTPGVPGTVTDREGEDVRVDLLSASVALEGSVLRGSVTGVGVAENGAWLDVDLAGGTAPDLRLGFGRGWTRIVTLDGGPPVAEPVGASLPTISGDTLTFALDLGGTGRIEAGRSGSAVASVHSFDGRVEDDGPGGILGEPPDEAVDVLLAIADAGTVADADLAVAIAVTFGSLRAIVADDVVATVDADAVAWLRYGESLDAWLAAAGAPWRLGTLDALGKLVWAWPAGQAAVYGAVPLVHQDTRLDATRYRFVTPDVDTFAALRSEALLGEDLGATARAVDAGVYARLRYRAANPLMESLCRSGVRTAEECEGWRADLRANADLGRLGDRPVSLWDGTSATWQRGVRRDKGMFVGDCATATALTIATLQALGIPALGMGWSGDDFGTPTHDVPLYYDGARFRGAEAGPGPEWHDERAFAYVTLPALHPVGAWTIGREPGGWSRGGSVAGGWASYREIARVLRDGLSSRDLGAWLDVQARGGWPTW